MKFFFTLSGFLITYIVLEEKQRTGSLKLKNFFLRRILRIWPLFYLMLGFAFVTPYLLDLLKLSSSPDGYEPDWWMSLLFLENYKMMIEGQLPNVSPLAVMWSLCIEEHFYILWGITFRFIKVRHTPLFLALSLVVCFVSRILFLANGWDTLEILTNLDFFAYGAIPAYLLIRYGERFEAKIMGIPYGYKYLIIGCTFLIFFSMHLFPLTEAFNTLFMNSLFGILFAFLIACTIPPDNKIEIGDRNLFSKWGKYTYGLYLYHTIVISFFFQICRLMGINLENSLISALLFFITLLAVILISSLSYRLFEEKFLKLKRYF